MSDPNTLLAYLNTCSISLRTWAALASGHLSEGLKQLAERIDAAAEKLRRELVERSLIPTAKCASDQSDVALEDAEIVVMVIACSEKLRRELEPVSGKLSKELRSMLEKLVEEMSVFAKR